MRKILLTEAAFDRYWQIVKPIYDKILPASGLKEIDSNKYTEFQHTQRDVREIVKWTIKTFKKQDRITWFLKLFRIGLLWKFKVALDNSSKLPSTDILGIEKSAEFINDFVKYKLIGNNDNREKIIADAFNLVVFNNYGTFVYNTRKDAYEHFFSQNIPGIQNYQIPSGFPSTREVFNDLTRIEREFNEKQNRFISMDAPDVEPTVIIQYENGAQWLNLNKSYCDLEARSMGHCGNSAAGSYRTDDRILSFRTIEMNPVTKKKAWVPHLTFILDPDTGMLGEMKGRNNQKPDKKYHGVIVDLLRLPIIKGIKGGGYLAENNFMLNDLPEEVAEQLVEEKPELADLQFLHRKFGASDERTRNKVFSLLNENELPNVEFIEGGLVLFDKWKNVTKISILHGSSDMSTLKDIIDVVVEGGSIEKFWYINGDDDNDLEMLFDEIPKDISNKLFNYIVDNTDSNLIEEWEESHGDLEIKGSSILHFLQEEGKQVDELEDIMDVANMAVRSGYDCGVYSQFATVLNDWLKDPNSNVVEKYSPWFKVLPDEEGNIYPYDNPIALVQDENDFIKMLIFESDALIDMGGEWINMFDFKDIREHELPQYPEFDEKAAVETFIEHLNIG